MLIIHGGRTSQSIKNYKESKLSSFMKIENNIHPKIEVEKTKIKDGFTLSDMWALKLDKLEWIRIVVSDESKIVRTNHWLAAINENTLFIFGGNGANSMYSNSEYLISLNSEKQNKVKPENYDS